MAVPHQRDNIDPCALAIDQYLRLGFSIIPVADDKRPSELLPGRSWSTYQRRRSTATEWMGWWQQGARNLAIIAGGAAKLYGLDADDPDFDRWLMSGVADTILKRTWVVRTCCDLHHVWLKSTMPVIGQKLKTGNRVLGDVRGDGAGKSGPSYLVAPPSLIHCPKHGLTGTYETVYGGPDQILEVENALAIFQQLADFFGARTAPQAQRPVTPPEEDIPSYDAEIPSPLSAESRKILERKVRDSTLSRKIKRALLVGAIAGEGEWSSVGYDNSAVDHAVCCSLVRAHFTDDDVLACFTTLHAGDFTFKNSNRKGNYGLRYLFNHTLPAAKKAVAAEAQAASQAIGTNFEVTGVVHVDFEDSALWVLTIKTSTGRVLDVKLRKSDFENDRSFCRAVADQSRFMPELNTAHIGAAQFLRFFGALAHMAVEDQDLPDDASDAGYLRRIILNLISGSSVKYGSDDPLMNSLGWIDGESVVLRSDVLMSRVKGTVQRAAPRDIWTAFQRLGGHADVIQTPGKKETMWVLPLSKVSFENDDQ